MRHSVFFLYLYYSHIVYVAELQQHQTREGQDRMVKKGTIANCIPSSASVFWKMDLLHVFLDPGQICVHSSIHLVKVHSSFVLVDVKRTWGVMAQLLFDFAKETTPARWLKQINGPKIENCYCHYCDCVWLFFTTSRVTNTGTFLSLSSTNETLVERCPFNRNVHSLGNHPTY